MSSKPLKAPFPYFGGKRTVAAEVWKRLGPVDNYIEPFAGSLAVLLLRPDPPRIETVNDLDCMVANFWRATAAAPEAVASWADGPVNEADLHARHRWLVLSDDAAAFRQRMRTDPDYFDARVAGWWCWGLCCWIGSGWCHSQGQKLAAVPQGRRYEVGGLEGQRGHGIHAGASLPQQLPAGQHPLTGVHTTPAELSQQVPLIGDLPRGGHRGAEREKVPNIDSRGVLGTPRDGLSQQLPKLQGYASGCVPEDSGTLSQRIPVLRGAAPGGVDAAGPSHGQRPQLADTFSRGRGVNGNDAAGTCEQRRAWLLDWFGRLRDRLRTVRVCCGHWLRVCDSESTTTRLGLTGVFLDPPYGEEAGRNERLYAEESLTVAREVRAWCLERGDNPQMRLALCGYDTEHAELEAAGWSVLAWKTMGGYGNRSGKGKANAARERIWFSPHCLKDSPGLFDNLGAA